MLRIVQCSNASAAKGYFASPGEYYGAGEQEMIGDWGGKAAEALGLSGPVDRFSFDRLCDNRHPETGDRLTARMRANRRVGYDFNFHACKSASLLYAMTEDPAILAAFRWAVAATMREMESGATVRVRKRGQCSERVSGNMAWAEYVHFTARPVGGVIDPHLHAHCFVANCSFDFKEGIWKAIDVASLKEGAPHWQEQFQKRFGRKLEELGYSVAWSGKSWEIAGIERATIERFSNRTRQVEREAVSRGITDAKAKDALGAKTREGKRKNFSMGELREHWGHRLSRKDEAAIAWATHKRRYIATDGKGAPKAYGSLSGPQYRAITARDSVRPLSPSLLPPGLLERQKMKLPYADYHEEPLTQAACNPSPRPGRGR